MITPTDISLRFLDMSDIFFNLVKSVLEKNIEQGNKTASLFGQTNNPEEREENHRRQTNWSDERIIIPTLFNLFHGMELFLKGIEYLENIPKKAPNHNLCTLLSMLKERYPKKSNLIEIFDYYIYPNDKCQLLSNFFKENDFHDSNSFYLIFKYPVSKNFKTEYRFSSLKKTKSGGIEFFQKVISDIDIINKEIKNFDS